MSDFVAAFDTVFEAVQRLEVINPSYMILPIEQGFNWTDAFANVPSGEWYLVVFRSRHRVGCDEARLTELDEHAQVAARHSSGFLHYFAGTPNATHDCLSFCLWASRPEAQTAGRHAAHQSAQQVANEMFEYFQLERYRVQKIEGVSIPLFQQL